MHGWGDPSCQRMRRKPTVSFAEAAERLGLTINQLGQFVRYHPDGVPEVVLDCKSHNRNDRKRYHMSDFRRWWASIQLKKESACPSTSPPSTTEKVTVNAA